MNYFLGIDGGQSHTTALIADERGRILGKGVAGPSNHTREPGGHERLINAVNRSVGEAGRSAGLLKKGRVSDFKFFSAHLAMTGEPEDKVQIVRGLLHADHLAIGHDSPGALAGALAGGEGIIVLAGTGSVACGEAVIRSGKRRFVRIGGHGFLFGDEGSAFAIAREAVTIELLHEDYRGQSDLKKALLAHFKRPSVKAIVRDFYAGLISRDNLASVAARIARLAERSDGTARGLIDKAAWSLSRMAVITAERLGVSKKPVKISYAGGVFKSRRLLTRFSGELNLELPRAEIVAPGFGPDVGALLLAYRNAGKRIDSVLLSNIGNTQIDDDR